MKYTSLESKEHGLMKESFIHEMFVARVKQNDRIFCNDESGDAAL
jgi:hypothetical protein